MFISIILIIRPRLAFAGSKDFWAFLSIDNKDDPICSPHMYVSFSQSSLNFEVQELFASQERTTALDFKGTSAPQFGRSDVVFCLFLVTNIKRYFLSIISRNAK